MSLNLFELLGPLEAMRSAPARLLKWDGGKYVPSEESITVHDFAGRHGSTGARGYAFLSFDSKCWEVASGLLGTDSEPIA